MGWSTTHANNGDSISLDGTMSAQSTRFAMANATAPLVASRERIMRHRLDRGGKIANSTSFPHGPPSRRSGTPTPRAAPTTALPPPRQGQTRSNPSSQRRISDASGPASKLAYNNPLRHIEAPLFATP